MNNLASKKCTPCEGDTLPLTDSQVADLLNDLNKWSASNGSPKKIYKQFAFKDFNEAMLFVNKIAKISENEGHHPDIHISYNEILIELWTHAINGLSENDFILAAKIDILKTTD